MILRLLAALCCLPAAGYGGGVGVLVARTAVEPPRIKPGDKATLGVETRDGFQRPLEGVSVKIATDSGFFESSHERTVQGSTDRRGQFRAVWQSDGRAEPGAREFSIIASKSGYLGRYPLTASVIVETAPEKQPDTSGKLLPDQGKTYFIYRLSPDKKPARMAPGRPRSIYDNNKERWIASFGSIIYRIRPNPRP